MMKVKVIELQPGIAGFVEDKDLARLIRIGELLPALEQGENIVLDFRQVKYATQSFIHALLGEALYKYREELLDRIEFKNCTPQLQSVIELVVDYSLGGFPTEAEPVG
ncbi:MAG: STAS-like domain-containing protein [Blastocatellia bacterium]|nr:STAS-like domain-containing protein [Blastocatellia bacterium]